MPKNGRRAPVRRGEGEVTQWPRGLLAYTSRGAEESTPSPEEDRTRNRILLAGRLVGLLRARGEEVEGELAELRRVEQASAAHDAARATEIVEGLLVRLDRRTGSDPPARPTS